ncbi:aldehyde dehydrogenase [Crocosphaera sp. Alani8]|uniref:aldehyde dehydrogenase n=1 Tax=Crocosphaera sp. Alani8 TaxID=3038952 RepID=UPI00313B5344
MLTKDSIKGTIEQQRNFFSSGATQEISFRKQQLEKLGNLIDEYESDIIEALHKDLKKPELEGCLSAVLTTKTDIKYALKNIKKWVKSKRVSVPLEVLPGQGYVQPQPKGVALIIGAWNYPFHLTILPLIGAIAAGNCAIIKPSELTQNTSKIIAEIINNNFDSNYIKVIEGAKETSQQLLQEKFDHIFFTGSSSIGKIVMEAAAKHLTPVTLELGGKSPCIVDTNINIKETAKRIAWGKFLNNGQTCIAPDYLLVNRQIKQQLLDAIVEATKKMYGDNPAKNPDYGRIINHHHFNRLCGLLEPGKIVLGGQVIPEENYIYPTIIDQVSPDFPIMQDEIFGPILPILEYDRLEEAIAFINERPKPLALYLFSNDKKQQKIVLERTISGGVCINDTIMQLQVLGLPFGGVGNSGMGSYHGKASFDTFSHYKSVLKRSFLLETNLRFPPYKGKLKWLKLLLG